MKYLSSGASILLLATGMSGLSHAEQTTPVGCVEVSVGGYKAPDYNCLSQQMSSPQSAEANQKNQEALKAGISKKAPNQVGLATPAATSIRMGNTFGTSVKPQRPAPGQ
ncbi:hypothetical protein [Pseudomonas gingeri]|uniref:Uncharacterized protein n=1 Tax=Pseudomonas gingeri TaxID=117681 RepID=A0A7Y7YC19_9PSED|nr:hypothetical protein [Pseudomonas gingeri]NWB30095.1 hypothetical protein [Pseudomonas gingeri]NWC33684.1 hypothetical protein [Pseudomonas gingeri]NWD05728.1 hypothetical protein [Pseudomonas gingeri]NWD51869.1 hypothetical protein [Pseudomonas gingeri]NWE32206.1 hypothetical protein [Pseudomonas gingeri]